MLRTPPNSTFYFAIRFQPEARQFFEHKKRKTNGIIAMRAVANKLSRAAFFLSRDETIYRPEKLSGVSSWTYARFLHENLSSEWTRESSIVNALLIPNQKVLATSTR